MLSVPCRIHGAGEHTASLSAVVRNMDLLWDLMPCNGPGSQHGIKRLMFGLFLLEISADNCKKL